jgi:hypothetical protein
LKNKKILLIGPFPDPISGVSISNKVVKEILENEKGIKVSIVNTSYPFFKDSIGSFSIKKALFFLKVNFNVLKTFNNDIIYTTPGQTFFGIIKYAPFILLGSILKKELIIHVHGNHLGKQFEELKGIKKRIFCFLVSKFTKGDLDERIIIEAIHTDGHLASVFTPYSFYVKGKLSHCGANSFQLVKQNTEWKIQYIIDTRRKDNCKAIQQ